MGLWTARIPSVHTRHPNSVTETLNEVALGAFSRYLQSERLLLIHRAEAQHLGVNTNLGIRRSHNLSRVSGVRVTNVRHRPRHVHRDLLQGRRLLENHRKRRVVQILNPDRRLRALDSLIMSRREDLDSICRVVRRAQKIHVVLEPHVVHQPWIQRHLGPHMPRTELKRRRCDKPILIGYNIHRPANRRGSSQSSLPRT
jgi:hypothetical protein